jgi:hypothetical protein
MRFLLRRRAVTSHAMKTLNRIVKPQLSPNARTNKYQNSNSIQTINKFIQIRASKGTPKCSITTYPGDNFK